MSSIPPSASINSGAVVAANNDSGRRLLIRGATVLSMDPTVGDMLAGDILVEGSDVRAVGADLSAAGRDGAALIIDGTGRIAVPGFVDGHRHCWQNQFRRLIPDVDGNDAYIAVAHQRLALHYLPDDIYAGNLISALGCLDAGITTIVDFSHNSRSAAHSDAAIQALVDAGIRAVHVSCAPLAGAWDRQWPADLERLALGRSAARGLVTLRMGLLGTPDLPGGLALDQDRLAYARGLGLSVTVDGTLGDGASGILETLGAAGVLGPDITLIHCLDLTARAWRYIADSGTRVVLAPTSDMHLGIGGSIPPIQIALDNGIRPGLSIDVEIAIATDMFTQMRAVLQLQRMLAFHHRYRGEPHPAPLTVRDVLEFATTDGARASGVPTVGVIAPGRPADLVLLTACEINNLPLNHAVGTVVAGADTRNVETVLVGGAIRKWQGALVGVDVAAVRATVETSRAGVLSRSGYQLDILA